MQKAVKEVNSSRTKSQRDTEKYIERPFTPACLDARVAILTSTSDLYHFSFCHNFSTADRCNQYLPKEQIIFQLDTIEYTQIVQNWKEQGHNLFYFLEIFLLSQFTSLMLSWLTAQIATEKGKDDSIPKWFLKYSFDITWDQKFLLSSKSGDWYLLYVSTTYGKARTRIFSASS